MSFQPFAARKHKEIHRINNATSTWHKFDDGLKKATRAWESNQYPPAFYKPVVRKTMLKMMESENTNNLNTSWRPAVNRTTRENPVFCLQCRGNESDQNAKKQRGYIITTVFTTRKNWKVFRHHSNHLFIKCLPVEWSIRLNVQAVTPAMLDNLASFDQTACSTCQNTVTCWPNLWEFFVHIRTNIHLSSRGWQLSRYPKIVHTRALYINRERPGVYQREAYRQHLLTIKL